MAKGSSLSKITKRYFSTVVSRWERIRQKNIPKPLTLWENGCYWKCELCKNKIKNIIRSLLYTLLFVVKQFAFYACSIRLYKNSLRQVVNKHREFSRENGMKRTIITSSVNWMKSRKKILHFQYYSTNINSKLLK